jgi:NAD(P)-dependent dehydrogenase (short-subunit alcohol dehydrogenase family)
MIALNPFSLSGKKILVTGASSGIGHETCLKIAEQGGSVIAVARRSNVATEVLSLLPTWLKAKT